MSSGGDDMPHEEHEEHANHEAWVIPYADLLTLLMAMFIALFAISSVNPDKAKKVSIGFSQAGENPLSGLFNGSSSNSAQGGNGSGGNGDPNKSGGSVGLDKSTPGTKLLKSLANERANLSAAKVQEHQKLTDVQKQIQDAAKKLGLAQKLTFDLRDNGLVVRLASDSLLFNSGDDALQPQGRQILDAIGAVLKTLPDNPIRVEGHTDNVTISTLRFRTNWSLSAARAESVLVDLTDRLGIPATQLELAAWGDTKGIARNDTEAGRAQNRRVEIIVESTLVAKLLKSNGLTGAPDGSGKLDNGPAKVDLRIVK